ncbi:MAG: LysR family transcriptional regulator [Hyphomonadaceae bacterium]|jgi:DNA-binding transcriptional LysR family regulator|nr:LysR family transcriptional regulator [Hyphomonadaceae bacterium]
MDLHALDLFVAVARSGGFAAAARERDLAPSSVSRAIATLEARLGLRLFQRTTRLMSLTEAGSQYLARVEPLLDELGRAASEAASRDGRVSGTLRLTASLAMGVDLIAPLLPRFHAQWPGVAVDCVFTDTNLDLIGERIDLAIRLAPAIEGDLIATRLMKTRYRIVASPDYLARGPALARPDDLAAHRCLRLSLRNFRTRWLFADKTGAETSVSIDGDFVFSTPLAIRQAALAGLGPAMLVDWQVRTDLASGRLIDVFPDWEATATTFDSGAWAVYPSRAWLPAKVRAAIDFFRAELAA